MTVDHKETAEFVDKVILAVKSQGKFDSFRKECLTDVETFSSYQNIRQLVLGNVARFLNKQVWRPGLSKNHIRDMLRRDLQQSHLLRDGVKKIVDQLVAPQIQTLIRPVVEKSVDELLNDKSSPVKTQQVHEESTSFTSKDVENIGAETSTTQHAQRIPEDVPMDIVQEDEDIIKSEDIISPEFEPLSPVSSLHDEDLSPVEDVSPTVKQTEVDRPKTPGTPTLDELKNSTVIKPDPTLLTSPSKTMSSPSKLNPIQVKSTLGSLLKESKQRAAERLLQSPTFLPKQHTHRRTSGVSERSIRKPIAHWQDNIGSISDTDESSLEEEVISKKRKHAPVFYTQHYLSDRGLIGPQIIRYEVTDSSSLLSETDSSGDARESPVRLQYTRSGRQGRRPNRFSPSLRDPPHRRIDSSRSNQTRKIRMASKVLQVRSGRGEKKRTDKSRPSYQSSKRYLSEDEDDARYQKPWKKKRHQSREERPVENVNISEGDLADVSDSDAVSTPAQIIPEQKADEMEEGEISDESDKEVRRSRRHPRIDYSALNRGEFKESSKGWHASNKPSYKRRESGDSFSRSSPRYKSYRRGQSPQSPI